MNNYFCQFLLIVVILFLLVSCITIQSKKPFLEMNNNEGKFRTEEDIELGIKYSNKQREKIEKNIHHNNNKIILPLKINRTTNFNGCTSIQPLVPVLLNGKEFYFIFDTGGSYVVLPQSILRILGISTNDEESDFIVCINEMSFGNNKKNFVFAQYYSKSFFKYVGHIGWNYFKDNSSYLRIDYRNQELVINAPKPLGNSIPCEITEAGNIIITVELDGISVRALLDTGNEGNSIADNRKLNLPMKSNNFETNINNFNQIYTGNLYTHIVNEIKIDTTVLSGEEILLLNETEFKDLKTLNSIFVNEKIDIVLGSPGFFNKCVFTIDYKNKLCWIETY